MILISARTMMRNKVGVGRCKKCNKIIDVGQFMPVECPLIEMTKPFRNLNGVEIFRRTGWCQECIDDYYGVHG